MEDKTSKYIAKVSIEFEHEGVRWLAIEPHMNAEEKIVGYYLFGHDDLSTPSLWDTWFQNLEGTFEAGKDYGVEKDDWIAQK